MITRGEGAARLIGGETGKTIAEGFITVKTAGIRELAEELEELAQKLGKANQLENAVKKAARIIERAYAVNVGDVTGNLKASLKTKAKRYEDAVIAITGPVQTGPVGSSDDQKSGNHAWLVEFGTDRRRPGTKGRRTYVNVHQMVNGKMRRHSTMNDQQFASQSKGYYFLMGSRNEPTRQARAGSGYPHDFGYSSGKQHPIVLHPGEDYGPMPAKHAMQRAIEGNQQAVFNSLKAAIENTIEKLQS